MVDTTKPTLGYWKIRGTSAPVRYIFEYLKVPYNNVMYEVKGEAPNIDMSDWFNVKFTLGLDFPNLPYIIDGDVKITELTAVLRYVTNKYGPHLNGKTVTDVAYLDMLFSLISDVKKDAAEICYTTGDKELLTKKAIEKLKPIELYLKGKKFIAGDYLSWVDFLLIETLDYVNYFSDEKVFETYPEFKEYFNRFCEIPEIKEYIASDRFIKKPFNMPFAKINNV
jgi:glutathione S-transferase